MIKKNVYIRTNLFCILIFMLLSILHVNFVWKTRGNPDDDLITYLKKSDLGLKEILGAGSDY